MNPKTGRPTLDRSKLSAHLPGHLRYEVDWQLDEDEKKGLDFQTATLNRATTQVELDTKRRAFLGSQLRTVAAANYDPQLFGIEVRAAQRLGALDDEAADRLLGLTDPAQIKAITDSFIAQAGGEAQELATVETVEGGVAGTQFVPRSPGMLSRAPEGAGHGGDTQVCSRRKPPSHSPMGRTVHRHGGLQPRRQCLRTHRQHDAISVRDKVVGSYHLIRL